MQRNARVWPVLATVNARVAYLFPAFGMRYRGAVARRPVGFDDERERLLAAASGVVSVETQDGGDSTAADDVLSHSLQEHYRSYINSCALAAVAADSGVQCTIAAGYSMGLFAALTHCSALSFEDGLRLIKHVVSVAHGVIEEGDYRMGAVIGLTVDEVGVLIERSSCTVEIADVSADRVVVVAGPRAEVEKTLDCCASDGCLSAKMLPVSLPFHSSWMGPAEAKIRAFLPRIRIRPPRCDLVSAVDQQILRDEAGIAHELSCNIVSPLDWLGTTRAVVDSGVVAVVECGFSEHLCKFVKGLDGAVSVYHPKIYDRLATSAERVPHEESESSPGYRVT